MGDSIYQNDRWVQKYERNIAGTRANGAPPREVQVDHLWSRILKYYFEQEDTAPDFDVQRESYTTDQGQKRTNVAVANFRGEPPREHKVLVVEAKRPLADRNNERRTPHQNDFNTLKNQLLRYLIQARGNDAPSGAVQTVYGVVAIGMWAQFVQLPRNRENLLPAGNRNTRAPLAGSWTFHVRDDADVIHALINGWVRTIQDGLNT